MIKKFRSILVLLCLLLNASIAHTELSPRQKLYLQIPETHKIETDIQPLGEHSWHVIWSVKHNTEYGPVEVIEATWQDVKLVLYNAQLLKSTSYLQKHKALNVYLPILVGEFSDGLTELNIIYAAKEPVPQEVIEELRVKSIGLIIAFLSHLNILVDEQLERYIKSNFSIRDVR